MKYYYGNSYKEALSNDPIEIADTKTLRSYEEVYSVVIPANEEEFWVIVYSEKDSQEEHQEHYDDFDDARADFKYMIEQTPDDYEFVVLQHVIESDIDGEQIEEIECWGLD